MYRCFFLILPILAGYSKHKSVVKDVVKFTRIQTAFFFRKLSYIILRLIQCLASFHHDKHFFVAAFKDHFDATSSKRKILVYLEVWIYGFKGCSDVSTTMSIFISLPNSKSLCVLLMF